MNTIENNLQVVQKQAETQEVASPLEAIQELSSIELAYVGGGTASVSFV